MPLAGVRGQQQSLTCLPMSAQFSATAVPRGARSYDWCVFWCQEKVYKQDFQACRAEVRKCIEPSRGRLACFRKASKFRGYTENLLNSGRSSALPSNVLITDWRETKLCYSLVEQLVCRPPELFVILCESNKQALRVHCWLRTLSGSMLPFAVVNPQKSANDVRQQEFMNCATEYKCQRIVDLCRQLNEACLQGHCMAAACANFVDTCDIDAPSTFAPRGLRMLPLLSTNASDRGSSSGAGSADGQQPGSQSKAEMTCRYMRTSRECPHAGNHVVQCKLDASRSRPSCDRPALRLEQDSSVALAPSHTVINDIMNTYSKQEIEALLVNSSLERYED